MAEKCSVRDGKHVEPCKDLRDMCEGDVSASRAKGVYRWPLTNLETHQPSRTFFALKCSAYPKGFAFNFCPWCGERIDAPLLSDEEG